MLYKPESYVCLKQEENERQRRVNESRLLSSGKKQFDQVQRRSSYMKDLTQQELVRVFNGVVVKYTEPYHLGQMS